MLTTLQANPVRVKVHGFNVNRNLRLLRTPKLIMNSPRQVNFICKSRWMRNTVIGASIKDIDTRIHTNVTLFENGNI